MNYTKNLAIFSYCIISTPIYPLWKSITPTWESTFCRPHSANGVVSLDRIGDKRPKPPSVDPWGSIAARENDNENGKHLWSFSKGLWHFDVAPVNQIFHCERPHKIKRSPFTGIGISIVWWNVCETNVSILRSEKN